jgi:hypothetical protein
VALFGVPELTWSASIKLNTGLCLRRFPDALSIGTGQFPQASGPTAKPSGDYIPLGGFVFYLSAMRQTWMKANYFVAIAVAMMGWLWLIVWIARQLI